MSDGLLKRDQVEKLVGIKLVNHCEIYACVSIECFKVFLGGDEKGLRLH